MHVFGPVPSRRLGRSLGVNHIPPKVCSYACRYCQLGSTLNMSVERRNFFDPSAIAAEVEAKLEDLKKSGDPVDYLAFVPDGEPTLDLGIGTLAEKIKAFGVPIAVISNASLIGDPEVQEALMQFDWVSLKVDGATEDVWRFVDRPHKKLSFDSILKGVGDFASSYEGHLETETMLIAGGNDGDEQLEALASFLESVSPAVCRLSSPTRPPACPDVACVDEERLAVATATFQSHGLNPMILNAYEGDDFTRTGDVRDALLSILSVHPMKEAAVARFLEQEGDDPALVERMVADGDVVKADWRGDVFYARNLRNAKDRESY
ncbi:MAG: radical SAM protein [Synergistota bacterium]|nr:radical SAM protein [Synergistota bacterium]